MSAVTQRRLAIVAAVLAAAVFIAANAHLFIVAFQSQPACTLTDPVAAAKPAC